MKLTALVAATFLFFQAAAQQTAIPSSIYSFKVTGQKGGSIDFAKYKGKKILIVNTPANANYNPRYKELEAFYQKHKDQVVIIAFLDDDFGPAPGAPKGGPIENKNYGVSFPVTAKVFVKSDKMAPIYQWLTEKKYNKLQDTEVKWDFHKFIINEEGKLVAVIDPKIKFESPEVLAALGN
jgi:glutathione peroxidase